MFNLVPTWILRSYSAKLLSSWVTSSIYWYIFFVPLQVQNFELLVEIGEIPLSPFA